MKDILFGKSPEAGYDPRDPNDRRLLGVQGTLAEAALFTLRTRLHEGRWTKAKKGRLQITLPVGYVLGSAGAWEMEPNMQVRERLRYSFAALRRLGVARRVVAELRQQGREGPTRLTGKEGYGALVWKAPTLSAIMRRLSKPVYTGAYAYGRWRSTGPQRLRQTGKARGRPLPVDQWPVCLQQPPPASLSWEEYMQNRQRLRQNWNRDMRPGAAREGPALLQGIVSCGVCGRKMAMQNRAATDKRSPASLCHGGYEDGVPHICQSMPARPVDAGGVTALLDAVSPLRLAVARQVREQVEQHVAAQRRQWELPLEQACYDARVAQRKYEAVEPAYRLVAAT